MKKFQFPGLYCFFGVLSGILRSRVFFEGEFLFGLFVVLGLSFCIENIFLI
jgi:hypothetical protein